MTGDTGARCRRGPEHALGCAWLAPLPPAALWVTLTAFDGRTYHLAPLIVAAAPGLAARVLGLRIGLVVPTLAMAGIVASACAWGLIESLDIFPSATLLHGQPGGVRAEVAVGAAIGVLAGALASLPPRRAGTTVRTGRDTH